MCDYRFVDKHDFRCWFVRYAKQIYLYNRAWWVCWSMEKPEKFLRTAGNTLLYFYLLFFLVFSFVFPYSVLEDLFQIDYWIYLIKLTLTCASDER